MHNKLSSLYTSPRIDLIKMAISKNNYRLFIVLFICILSACSSNNNGRYSQKHDSTPTRLPNSSELHDATARYEPQSRGGNKNYKVLGKHYKVLNTAKNFTETGIASWYGEKFHGHLTSNGEIYDMYSMSAAHKNLPLPTYVKVVNNDNGKSTIVRVNDRGPFHPGRIIDLSYTAAYKIGMLKTGTANVTITAITDFTPQKNTTIETIGSPIKTLASGGYIQAFASKNYTQATKLAKALSEQYKKNTQLDKINGIFRVLIGPIKQQDELMDLLTLVKKHKYPSAFIRQIK